MASKETPISKLLSDVGIPEEAPVRARTRDIFVKNYLSPGAIRQQRVTSSDLKILGVPLGVVIKLQDRFLSKENLPRRVSVAPSSLQQRNVNVNNSRNDVSAVDTVAEAALATPLAFSQALVKPITSSTSFKDNESTQTANSATIGTKTSATIGTKTNGLKLGNVAPSSIDRLKAQLAEETTAVIEEDKFNHKAPSTLDSILEFRVNYNKKIRDPRLALFDDEDGDTIARSTIKYVLNRNDELAFSSRHQLLTVMKRSVFNTNKSFSPTVNQEVIDIMSSLWNDGNLARRKNEQNANREVTEKDLLHLINSIILEQKGGPLKYCQVQTLTSAAIVMQTSRRFSELLSITVPEMKLSVNGDVRVLEFSYAVDKNLKFGVFRQNVAEGKTVESCAVTWILIQLQALGVIDDAVECMKQGHLVNFKPEKYMKCSELASRLKEAERQLRQSQKEKLKSSTEEKHIYNTVWDKAMELESQQSDPNWSFAYDRIKTHQSQSVAICRMIVHRVRLESLHVAMGSFRQQKCAFR